MQREGEGVATGDVCEFCSPRMSRRRLLGLVAATTTAALLGRPDPAAAARAVQTGYGVAIEPRSTWAGDSHPILGLPGEEDVKFLLVHHTAGPSQGDPVQLIRQVYDFHTGPDRAWPDVAYNFFVEPGGRVFEGRDGSLQRAVEASATGGNQGAAQLVCLLGDFTSRNPTDAQLRSLNETLAWLADQYQLDTSPGASATFTSRGSNKWPAGAQVTADTISGHREMSETACPGDTFFPYLKSRVQAEVDALRKISQQPSQVTPRAAPASSSTDVSTTVAAATPTPSTDESPTTDPPAASVTTARSAAPATVAEGPLPSPPTPAADDLAANGPQPEQTSSGRASTTAAVWGLGAGAAALVAFGAVYVGVRGREDEATWSPPVGKPLAPPPGGDTSK